MNGLQAHGVARRDVVGGRVERREDAGTDALCEVERGAAVAGLVQGGPAGERSGWAKVPREPRQLMCGDWAIRGGLGAATRRGQL